MHPWCCLHWSLLLDSLLYPSSCALPLDPLMYSRDTSCKVLGVSIQRCFKNLLASSQVTNSALLTTVDIDASHISATFLAFQHF